MQSIEQASNAELLSALTGSRPAQLLLERFGGLAPLARASLDDLQQLKGIGKSKAAAIRSAFLRAGGAEVVGGVGHQPDVFGPRSSLPSASRQRKPAAWPPWIENHPWWCRLWSAAQSKSNPSEAPPNTYLCARAAGSVPETMRPKCASARSSCGARGAIVRSGLVDTSARRASSLRNHSARTAAPLGPDGLPQARRMAVANHGRADARRPSAGPSLLFLAPFEAKDVPARRVLAAGGSVSPAPRASRSRRARSAARSARPAAAGGPRA